jgi:hypothetical protein
VEELWRLQTIQTLSINEVSWLPKEMEILHCGRTAQFPGCAQVIASAVLPVYKGWLEGTRGAK